VAVNVNTPKCLIRDILIVNVSAMSRSRHLKLLFYKLLTTQLMSEIETITLNKLSSVILKIIFPGMYLGTQTLNKEALSCIITLHIQH
jgi:hypothetical protein